MGTLGYYPVAVSQIVAIVANVIWVYAFGEQVPEETQTAIVVVVQSVAALISQLYTRSKKSLGETRKRV